MGGFLSPNKASLRLRIVVSSRFAPNLLAKISIAFRTQLKVPAFLAPHDLQRKVFLRLTLTEKENIPVLNFSCFSTKVQRYSFTIARINASNPKIPIAIPKQKIVTHTTTSPNNLQLRSDPFLNFFHVNFAQCPLFCCSRT